MLTAASLLMEVTKEFVEYDDECLTEIESQQFISNGTSDEISVISVAPNPVNNLLKITVPIERDFQQLEIRDGLGRTVKQIEVGEYQTQIELNTSRLANGFYTVVPMNDANQRIKFIVAH